MLSNLLESLGAVSAGEHLAAVGGGLVAVALLLLLLCALSSGNKNDNSDNH